MPSPLLPAMIMRCVFVARASWTIASTMRSSEGIGLNLVMCGTGDWLSAGRSGRLSMARYFERGGRCVRIAWLGGHIEFEYAGDHDNGVGLVTVFEQRKLQCLSAIDEKAAAEMSLVLDDPMTVTVSADIKKRSARRGRFSLAHNTAP